MAFDADLKHWPTVVGFAAYLQSVPRPPWCHAITNHNTYIPDETTWRGMASMQSMIRTYTAKGWTAGPHLYLAAAAPNPADTGIWQLTPITHPGVHAGACNADHLGIENVGNFEARPPTDAQYTLLLAVNRLLIQHWGLSPNSVGVHNECMANRTCPGQYLTGAQIRADLTPPPSTRFWKLIRPCAPLTARAGDAPLAVTGALNPGDVVQGELEAVNGWLWISDKPTTKPGIGFIPVSYVVPI